MRIPVNYWLDRLSAGLAVALKFAFRLVLALGIVWIGLGRVASAQGVSTTTVQGTVYLANGQVGSGTLAPELARRSARPRASRWRRTVSTWRSHPDGFVSVNLAPNLGSTPAGLYYTAVYHMSDGSTSTQYWVVPAAAQATLAQVQAQLMPAAQAVQTVSKAYVDEAIAALAGSILTASTAGR
jgi:hypothetical protein